MLSPVLRLHCWLTVLSSDNPLHSDASGLLRSLETGGHLRKTLMNLTLLAALLALMLMGGCDNAESIRTDETRVKLVGTWLMEAESGGVKSRRVLSLDQEGKFAERIHAPASDGQSERLDYAGEWSYDGINLKRRYLKENGRQFSGGKIRYATQPLVSVSSSELVTRDAAGGIELVYRRVAEGTQP